MFDRSLVTSNFDTETLISEKYLTYLLLAQIEAGLLGLEFDVVDDDPPTNVSVTIDPPFDYEREYPKAVELPEGALNTLSCRLVPGDDSAFLDAALTPDGMRLLTRSTDNMVNAWDLETRLPDEQLAFEVEPAIGSAFNADGTKIATAAVDRDIRVWDLATKTQTDADRSHFGCFLRRFLPDGQRLVSGRSTRPCESGIFKRVDCCIR